MHYVHCGSYEPLFFALYLKKKGKKIKIITYNKNIVKYCIKEKIEHIKYNQIVINGSSFYKIFAFKKNLDKLVERMNFCEKDFFYLTGKIKTLNVFYLSKALSKKGNVYYYPVGIPGGKKRYKPEKYKPIFLRGEILRFLVKIILDIDLIYYQGHGIPIIGIDNSFLEKNNIEEYKIDLSSEDLFFNLVNKNKVNYEEFENLIVDSGALTKIIKNDSLVELYENLLKLPIKFAFKLHPSRLRRTSDAPFYNIFKLCSTIPEYIPVELFFNNVKKNVISVYSTSLVTASQFSHLRAISLLELVEWYDESFKKDVKKMLIKKSNNKILFPRNFDELKEILLN